MVETDNEILTADQREQLQKSYLSGRFHNRQATINDRILESDGRKRARVIKECINAGLLLPDSTAAWNGNDYVIAAEVLGTIMPATLSLFDTWSTLHTANSHREAFDRPWIRVETLPIDVQCALLAEPPEVDWFVVSRTPYEYHAQFADEPQTRMTDGTPSQAFGRYWSGPFVTLAEAIAHQKQCPGTCLAVSSAALRASVTAQFAERKLQWSFANNLLWGLGALGIVPKDVLFDSEGKPTIDSQLSEGYSLRFSSDPNPPKSRSEVQWPTNLAQSIERLKARIARAEQQLATLRLIDSQVMQSGGWTQFMDAFELRLRSSST